MTIFEILKADHRKVTELLKKATKSPEFSAERKESLQKKIRDEFMAHAISEEKAVYRVLRENMKTHDLVMEAYEEHGIVKMVLAQLSEISADEDVWTAKMSVAKELIQNHIKEEESDLFKKMRATCDPQDLKSMAKEFVLLKKQSPWANPPQGRRPSSRYGGEAMTEKH